MWKTAEEGKYLELNNTSVTGRINALLLTFRSVGYILIYGMVILTNHIAQTKFSLGSIPNLNARGAWIPSHQEVTIHPHIPIPIIQPEAQGLPLVMSRWVQLRR